MVSFQVEAYDELFDETELNLTQTLPQFPGNYFELPFDVDANRYFLDVVGQPAFFVRLTRGGTPRRVQVNKDS